MFNPDAFTRAIARSKERRERQAQASQGLQVVIKPSNITDTASKPGLSADEQHEQYRITIINSAIAHIKTNKPKGK